MTEQNDNNETTTKNIDIKTVLTLLLYCISGSLLTLVNKLAIIAFPYINLLLVLQNGITVILLLINFYIFPLPSQSLPTLNMAILKIWIPVVLLFVTMLISSLFALVYVSVPTVIVIRNLSTLIVAILDYFILDSKLNNLSMATLLGMFSGAIFYAIHDLTFSMQGYIWLCINILGTSLYQIYIKKVVNMPLMKDTGPIVMSYYNNLISLPTLIILAGVMGELKGVSGYFQSIFLPNIKSICTVVLSCVLGFLLSISAFALNKIISPTSMMVANNVNKFALIILSEIFVQSTLDITASIGALSVLFYGWLYSQTKEQFAKLYFLVVTTAFIVVYAVTKYQHEIGLTINTDIFPLQFNSVRQTNISSSRNDNKSSFND